MAAAFLHGTQHFPKIKCPPPTGQEIPPKVSKLGRQTSAFTHAISRSTSPDHALYTAAPMVKDGLAGGSARQKEKSPVCATGLFWEPALTRAQLALRLRRGVRSSIAPIGHELVEFGLVLSHTQALKEFTKLPLFVLEPA